MARFRAHVNTKYRTTTALFLWVVVVFFMHVLPIDPNKARSFNIPHFDKFVHFGMFFVLSALAIRRRLSLEKQAVGWDYFRIALLCCVYGFALEVIQPMAGTHRSSDAIDALADAIGVLTGALAFKSVRALLFFRH